MCGAEGLATWVFSWLFIVGLRCSTLLLLLLLLLLLESVL
jgi:hypothetical protein